MNIAYMILAHHQPKQLLRLVNRLQTDNTYFFIHVDKKSPFIAEIETVFASNKQVVVFANHEVNWMGFTTIDAEIELMERAYNFGVPFKYYVLMSGQDYPIKSNEYINKFFAQSNKDYISVNNTTYMSDGMKEKTRYFHFRDVPYINPRNPKKIPKLVYLYFGMHTKLKKYFPHRKFYKDLEVYFGSQWFALTHDTIAEILAYLKANPGYISSMRNTDGPDEIFFQTLVMNTPRKENVYSYPEYTKWLQSRKEGEVFSCQYESLRFMDWSENAKSKPAVLDMSYYQDIVKSTDLYGRKFDEVASAALMDKLDETILGK